MFDLLILTKRDEEVAAGHTIKARIPFHDNCNYLKQNKECGLLYFISTQLPESDAGVKGQDASRIFSEEFFV